MAPLPCGERLELYKENIRRFLAGEPMLNDLRSPNWRSPIMPRMSLHPQGLAPRIANLAEWRGHLLAGLGRQVALTADPVVLTGR